MSLIFFSYGRSMLNSYYAADMEFLLDYTWSLLFGVLVFVVFGIGMLLFNDNFFNVKNKNLMRGELMSGLIPCIILLLQVSPSFFMMCFYGGIGPIGVGDLGVNMKIMGQQWFWSYEYVDYKDWLKFDSYLCGVSDMKLGDLRLVEVDERLVVPCGIKLCFSVSSFDVIHSWALPSAGIKLDATPGVFNTYCCFFNGPGVFYGMCSEFCGVGHSFMPIVVECVPSQVFCGWVEDRKHLLDIATRLGDFYKNFGVQSFV